MPPCIGKDAWLPLVKYASDSSKVPEKPHGGGFILVWDSLEGSLSNRLVPLMGLESGTWYPSSRFLWQAFHTLTLLFRPPSSLQLWGP